MKTDETIQARSAIQLSINNGAVINTTIRDAFQKLVDVIDSFANENDALAAELKLYRERCEELEVVAAALYLGQDDAREQFDMYRSAYLTTADDDKIWKPTEDDPFPY